MAHQLDREEVISRYIHGETCAMIAETYGCSASTVHRRLISWDVETRLPGTYSRVTTARDLEEHKAEIVERYLAGESGAKIAESYKCSYGLVYASLKSWGVAVSHRGKGTFYKLEGNVSYRIANHPDLGRVSDSELAREFNVSRQLVWRIRKTKEKSDERI